MFEVTQVGSWPRSRELLRALRACQKGEIPRADFERRADGEIRLCIDSQLQAGVDIVVDGELRRDNFYSFVTDKLEPQPGMLLALIIVCSLLLTPQQPLMRNSISLH